MNCKGCQTEKEECYLWQSKGYSAGLDWEKGHCFVFVFDEKEDIAEDPNLSEKLIKKFIVI